LRERGVLSGVANAATPEVISESNKADNCVQSGKAAFQSGKVVGDTNILYYFKDVDANIVSSEFEKLGFKSQENPSNFPDRKTNAIWFDRDVPIDDVKLVACALIRAGLKIQTIKPFRSDEKPDTIEVGTDPDYINAPALAVETILKSTKFERTY
jgi:hypothetical protein